MTKRAKYIKMLSEQLGILAVNGFHYKTCAFGTVGAHLSQKEKDDSKEHYDSALRIIQACLCNLVEHNPEQADALMSDLKIVWKTNPVNIPIDNE